MAATAVLELESRYQDITSTTEKLADELTGLRHGNQDLIGFRAFQPQESRLLANMLRDAIISLISLEENSSQSWLQGRRKSILDGRYYATSIISLRTPSQGPLIRAIELLETAEKRTEEYKRKVTRQSEDCTSTFARATTNKVASESLATQIGNCRGRTSAEIGRVNAKLSSSTQDLKENKGYLRLSHVVGNDAQRREERWKKIHKWTKPLVVTYPVTKVICWCKEYDVEEATAYIKEAELQVQQVQERRDELNVQTATLRSIADYASELSTRNHDLYDQSERMMQESKELAVEAEHMRNSARRLLTQLSAINDEMMLLSKTHGRLEEQKDCIRRAFLSIRSAIKPDATGRILTDLATAQMLMPDYGQDQTLSLNAGIGEL